MTVHTTLFVSAIGILLVIVSLSLWVLKTSRQVLHDISRVLQTYKEATKDRRITHDEKDAIMDSLEVLLVNLNKNIKKLLLPSYE